MTTTGALTADAALALRAEEPRHEVKQEFRELSGKRCFKRNADFQQMMSLIINTRDVKGTDKEAKERKEHRQRQERRAQPTADKKSTANNRLKSIPNSRGRAYPTAGQCSASGHGAETWRSQARRRNRKSMFRVVQGTTAPMRHMREVQHGAGTLTARRSCEVP